MGMKLRIRDGHASINNDTTVYEMPSGSLEIIGEDGRALFAIRLNDDLPATIEVGAASMFRQDGKIYDEQILVIPRVSNVVFIGRRFSSFNDKVASRSASPASGSKPRQSR